MLSSTLILFTLAAAPQVSSVVVYPDRAQVTRVAQAPCGGRTAVLFEGIPPAADPSSFRASANLGTVEGLRGFERTRKEAFSRELAQVESELEKVNVEQRALQDAAARAATGRRVGAQYETVATALISRDMTVGKPDTRSWQSAFDQSLTARLDAAQKGAELSEQQRLLAWREEDLRRRQGQLQTAATRRERVAEVLVSCPRGRPTMVELTYLVGGASWSPHYEARAQEPQGVELGAWATVQQSTGEDWTGARLTLSTAVPSQDATVPEIRRLVVYVQRRTDEKKVLVRREETISHAQVGSADKAEGEGSLAARAQGLSVQLEVPKPVDVPGTGQAVRVFVGRYKLPSQFAWRSAPALAPFAFRVAEVTNAAPFPLLAGPLESFGKSGFLGRYPQERVAQGAPFTLTFGVEDQVKVKRVVLEEVKREAGLFNMRKRYRYAYRFELANHLPGPVELELTDRVPVAELDDVTVEIGKKTTAGYTVHPQDGVVTWKLRLDKGEQRNVELHFHVDVPDSYDTGGL
jgi:uncharacterized protein (TIGR02231 family)